MLHHEYDIEENADVAQCEFDRISRHSGPIMLQIAVDSKLSNRQYSTHEVKEYLVDGPAVRRVVSIVGEDLRHVFDERDEELDVGDGIYL